MLSKKNTFANFITLLIILVMSAAIGLQAAEVETREPDIIQNSDQ